MGPPSWCLSFQPWVCMLVAHTPRGFLARSPLYLNTAHRTTHTLLCAPIQIGLWHGTASSLFICGCNCFLAVPEDACIVCTGTICIPIHVHACMLTYISYYYALACNDCHRSR